MTALDIQVPVDSIIHTKSDCSCLALDHGHILRKSVYKTGENLVHVAVKVAGIAITKAMMQDVKKSVTPDMVHNVFSAA